MNINNLHRDNKDVSAVPLSAILGKKVTSLKILKGAELKKHISNEPALLILISGKATFNTEQGVEHLVDPGDYVNIPVNVEHYVVAENESHLLLIK